MLYRPAWILFYVPLRLLFRLRFVGRENLPRRGPVIASGNHVSYLDPIMLALSSWRPISFMGKIELFEGPAWFAWLLRRVKAFPVRRGQADRDAITQATSLLERNRIVGIFPEGTRSEGGLGEAYGGAAMIAMRTGAPIVPVGIAGTDQAMPRGSRGIRLAAVTIVFGEPIRPEDAPEGSRRERMDALTAMLMERIATAVCEAGGEEE